MTWSDPIVEEVRNARDAYAARFNYDLRAIFRDLKEQERKSGRKFVNGVADVVGSESDKTVRPSALPTPVTDCPSPHTGQLG
jgi:hypothetical protein